MISRAEFYAGIIVLAAIVVYCLHPWQNPDEEAEKARIEFRDSMIQVQKDSAYARSLKFEIKADSLQAVVNRKNLDLNIIYQKIENEKKAMLRVSADSAISFFQRSITPH